jgi:orotate phosphoribosyltransferase
MSNTKTTIAKHLLEIKAVFFRPNEPFTWKSGIKSPVYCDNRLILSAPRARADVAAAFAELFAREYPDADVVVGEGGAVPHAALAAHFANLPMAYVRASQKEHGRGNRIEGAAVAGKKVVLIEDLISTGGSVLEVVEILREEGAEVLGIASIMTYGMKKGLDALAAANVRNVSLTSFDDIAVVAAEQGYIAPEDVARLIKFRDNPSDEGWRG